MYLAKVSFRLQLYVFVHLYETRRDEEKHAGEEDGECQGCVCVQLRGHSGLQPLP